MEKIIVEIKGEFITLDNLLKYAGVVDSGGQAGQVISEGLVKINGQTVKEKRKKVRPDDEVAFSAFLLSITLEKDESK